MRVEFLGTGGYHPSERRQTACFLLPELGVVFDAGTAAFRLRRQVMTPRIDIFLSHAHLDHIVGLTYLLAPLALGELQQVTLHASDETLEAVRNVLFHSQVFPVLPPFQFSPLREGMPVHLPGNMSITHWRQTSHPGTSRGFRVHWTSQGQSRSLCYVTDTSVDGSYEENIRNTDLLIHECYFPDTAREWASKTGHSCLADVLELARSAAVRRLVLVHIDPQLATDEDLGWTGTQWAGIPVAIGRDGDVLEI